MNWKKSSDYSIASDCGKWHIAKSFVEGVECYMVWENKDIVGIFKTGKEAKKEVERLRDE